MSSTRWSLKLTKGNTPLPQQPTDKQTIHSHREPDFSIEVTPAGLLTIKHRGGTPFIICDPNTRTYTMDVLNVPYIDVAKRKVELEAKRKAETELISKKQKKAKKE
jgi:hypothetical protein